MVTLVTVTFGSSAAQAAAASSLAGVELLGMVMTEPRCCPEAPAVLADPVGPLGRPALCPAAASRQEGDEEDRSPTQR